MIKSVITSYYLEAFKADLKDACKKMKVEYKLNVGEKRVIGSVALGGYDDIKGFVNMTDIYGYDVEIVIPEIDKMTNTGYEYLGCIKDDGLVSVHPNDNADFDFSTMDQIKTFPCDRCGKKTTRNVIHVFRKDGKITVYGSSCAKVKFGIDVNSLIAKFTTIKEQFGGNMDEAEFHYGGLRGYSHINAKHWATMAYHEVVEHGYVSASKVFNEGYGTSTTTMVEVTYTEVVVDHNPTAVKGYKYDLDNIDFDYNEFVEYAEVLVDGMEDGDFKFNMAGALEFVKEGAVHSRTKGFVTYMVFKFWHDTKKAKAEDKSYNEDYSEITVGDKFKGLQVKIENEFILEGNYGTVHIYTMRGVEDNIKYKWFSSKELNTEIEHIITSGTIKGLEDDAKYGKSVVITRCRTKEA